VDFQITWSDEAVETFEGIVQYLQTYFTDKEVARFVSAVQDKINLIEFFPTPGRRSHRFKNHHYTNILRKTMLVYRIEYSSLSIQLIQFWDGRQIPNRFKI